MSLILNTAISILLTGAGGSTYTVKFAEVKGDLNKDRIEDLVIVTQDTLDDKSPYKLEVFFLEDSGKRKLIVSTTKALEPEFKNGKQGFKIYGYGISDPTIVKGVLWLHYSLIRGEVVHKFRYQNGNFELIGYRYGESNGHDAISVVDFNLSTGDYISKEMDMAGEEEPVVKKTKKLIRPLPRLQDHDWDKADF